MSATVPAKVCQICYQDCSRKPRTKDGQGRYYCEECLEQKKAEAALLAGADPAPGPERKPLSPKSKAAPSLPEVDENPFSMGDDEGTPAGFWEQSAAASPASNGGSGPVLAPAANTCRKCGAGLLPGAVICMSCGFNTQTGKKMKIKTGSDGGVTTAAVAGKAGLGAMRFGLWLLGGGIAGVISLAVWIAIVVFTGFEIGWVAIGVGAFIGFGVAITGRSHLNAISGLIAAAIAFFVVAGWKIALYLVISAAINASPDVMLKEFEQELNGPEGESIMMSHLAYETALDMEGKGKQNVWPEGLEYASAIDRDDAIFDDYPDPVQKESRARWSKLSDADKQALKERTLAAARSDIDAMSQSAQSFTSFFTAKDIILMALWTVLACGLAFRIGAGAG